MPDGGGDAGRPFMAKRLFVWDGARLAAEIGLSYADQQIWRRHYLPGPSGLDDAPQVRVETGLQSASPADTTYAFLRDELGTVIGLMEDRVIGGADPLPLLARYLYTPYGEAHVEYGPELLGVSFDEAVGLVGGVSQVAAVPIGASIRSQEGNLVVEAVRLWETRRVFQGLWEGGVSQLSMGRQTHSRIDVENHAAAPRAASRRSRWREIKTSLS